MVDEKEKESQVIVIVMPEEKEGDSKSIEKVQRYKFL